MSTRVIGIWSYKGGVGKSTLALNLAGAVHDAGESVMILDLDPQGSATAAARFGKLPFTVTQDPKDPLLKSAQRIIIDYPPALEGREIAGRHHLILVPMRACLPDYHAAQRGIASIQKDRFVPVLNALDPRASEQQAIAAAVMQKYPGTQTMRHRAAYARGHNAGETVFQLSAMNFGVLAARAEMRALLSAIC